MWCIPSGQYEEDEPAPLTKVAFPFFRLPFDIHWIIYKEVFKIPYADKTITPDSSHHRRQLGRRYADRTVDNGLAHLQIEGPEMKDVQMPVPLPPSPPPATTSGLSHPKRKEVMRYDVREKLQMKGRVLQASNGAKEQLAATIPLPRLTDEQRRIPLPRPKDQTVILAKIAHGKATMADYG